MAVSDSQWLGAFVEGGYYLKLNKFIDADPELQAIFKDLHPNLVAAYSTYPYKSNNYYGFPQMPDVLIVYYRTDVFCDRRTSRRPSRPSTARSCPARPRRWTTSTGTMVKNFGEFFRRTKGDKLAGKTLDDDFYGIAYQAGKGYDFSTMQINAFIWQHGADIWDETKAPKGQAEGVVNSADGGQGVRSLSVAARSTCRRWSRPGPWTSSRSTSCSARARSPAIIQWIGFGESTINAADLEGRRQGRVRQSRARATPTAS